MVDKYHWTFDYVVWGVSYLNLQMLLADSQEYFPDFSGGGSNEVINGDDPANRDRMREIFGWKH